MKGATMKVVNVHSLPTELWYPYSRPGGTYVDQGPEGNQGNLANFVASTPDYLRLDWVILGL